MGTLTDLLRNPKATTSTKEVPVKKSLFERKVETVVISPTYAGNDFDITDEELKAVKESVATIDTDGKSRNEIIIGMYGDIKNPRTGKRFVIPGVDYTSENYIYEYAEMMRTLVNRPDDFKKIMNWE